MYFMLSVLCVKISWISGHHPNSLYSKMLITIVNHNTPLQYTYVPASLECSIVQVYILVYCIFNFIVPSQKL